MLDLCKHFGVYRQYAVETPSGHFCPELLQRHDTALNYLRTGGIAPADEPVEIHGARSSYFRAEYAYSADITMPGIEIFRDHTGLADAARRIHGRPVVVPAIVYANLMVPGQQLAVHTDVPEFRGANRKELPEWLLVVMHHSGLFDQWRMPIVTAVSYFGDAPGGEFVFWPDGPSCPAETFAAGHNSAIVTDTDSVFHGVAPVDDPAASPPSVLGAGLRWDAGAWTLTDADETTRRLGVDEVRISVSWKAYCFTDENERAAWETRSDDLSLEKILGMLLDDLRTRGMVDSRPESDTDLGLMLIDEYIGFPQTDKLAS